MAINMDRYKGINQVMPTIFTRGTRTADPSDNPGFYIPGAETI